MKPKLKAICTVERITHHDQIAGITPGMVCEVVQDFGNIFRVHFFENDVGDPDNLRSFWENQLEWIAGSKENYEKEKEEDEKRKQGI